MWTITVTGALGRLPRDCDRPYDRQLVERIVCVTAQAAGWNCNGTRLA
jgi:hypothetical protein